MYCFLSLFVSSLWLFLFSPWYLYVCLFLHPLSLSLYIISLSTFISLYKYVHLSLSIYVHLSVYIYVNFSLSPSLNFPFPLFKTLNNLAYFIYLSPSLFPYFCFYHSYSSYLSPFSSPSSLYMSHSVSRTHRIPPLSRRMKMRKTKREMILKERENLFLKWKLFLLFPSHR